MFRYDHRLLPPELWLSIIRWATYPQPRLDVSTFDPFLASFEQPTKGDVDALTVKYAVVQVCRLWRDFVLSILYEDVRVRHGAHALAEALGERYGDGQLGRCVRRLELPYHHTGTATYYSSDLALQILQSCPALETLVRPCMERPPDEVRFEFPIRSHPFPNLKRLEWWHYNHAARSGGINSLTDVLHHSPNLQYLTVGGELWMSSANSTVRVLELPVLTTLRIRRINFLFIREICRWQLPSLAHVIMEFPLDQNAHEVIWEEFGPRLCTVEIGRHVGFLLSDQITFFLRGCPQIKTFHYFIYFTSPPPIFNQPCALQCIYLHSHPCHMLADSEQFPRRHLSFLSQSTFPALRRIILYGDWKNIITESYFKVFVQIMNSRGCLVEHTNESSCTQS
ncbi:hypothetical protein AZE42_02778 [Rhizopogon vesiculosus]|uniref:F-box domain-containing protein n=1 Tax=Rhizopogon vesiculosus TaxID=180088 RepID=A0A1J8PTX1_9AGAM|nr:hypothetical protein AZE42_02778 [Rhizopogon vesiculosus]